MLESAKADMRLARVFSSEARQSQANLAEQRRSLELWVLDPSEEDENPKPSPLAAPWLLFGVPGGAIQHE